MRPPEPRRGLCGPYSPRYHPPFLTGSPGARRVSRNSTHRFSTFGGMEDRRFRGSWVTRYAPAIRSDAIHGGITPDTNLPVKRRQSTAEEFRVRNFDQSTSNVLTPCGGRCSFLPLSRWEVLSSTDSRRVRGALVRSFEYCEGTQYLSRGLGFWVDRVQTV